MKYFYECGGCDHYHPLGWIGDCRDDANRFSFDDEGNLVNYFGHGYKESSIQIVSEDYRPRFKNGICPFCEQKVIYDAGAGLLFCGCSVESVKETPC